MAAAGDHPRGRTILPTGFYPLDESLGGGLRSGTLTLLGGIPGVGKATYDAITTGDQPVLKAVVALTAILLVVVQLLTDILYRAVDPRVSLR